MNGVVAVRCRCAIVPFVPDPEDRSSSETEVAVPLAQLVVRMVAGVYRAFRVCPVCSALFAERKVAEGRFTDINYSRHFAGQHKEGQMATKTDKAPTVSPEDKAAARAEKTQQSQSGSNGVSGASVERLDSFDFSKRHSSSEFVQYLDGGIYRLRVGQQIKSLSAASYLRTLARKQGVKVRIHPEKDPEALVVQAYKPEAKSETA